MTRKERLTERNNIVRKHFYDLSTKNPKWRLDAVVEEVANKVFLSERTVDAILKYEGIYCDTAVLIQKNSNQLQIFN